MAPCCRSLSSPELRRQLHRPKRVTALTSESVNSHRSAPMNPVTRDGRGGGLCRFTAAPTASSQAIKPPQEGFYCPSSSPKATFLLPSLPYLWECIEVSWQRQKLISFELKSYNCLLHFGLSHCPQMDAAIEVPSLHGHA